MFKLPEFCRVLPNLYSHVLDGNVSLSSESAAGASPLDAGQPEEIDTALVEQLLRAKRLRSLGQRRLRQGQKTLFPLTKNLTHSGLPA